MPSVQTAIPVKNAQPDVYVKRVFGQTLTLKLP
jgi:hypothetical protein